jgi:hypothetical protein
MMDIRRQTQSPRIRSANWKLFLSNKSVHPYSVRLRTDVGALAGQKEWSRRQIGTKNSSKMELGPWDALLRLKFLGLALPEGYVAEAAKRLSSQGYDVFAQMPKA